MYYLKFEIDMILKNIFYPQDEAYLDEAFPIPDSDEIAGILANDSDEVMFRNFQAYGMNANSQNKRLAWEFIKFLLGEEMQQSLNLLGFPVNNVAFIEYSKLYLTKTPNFVSGIDEYTIDGYTALTEQKYVDAYAQYMEYLSAFVNELSLYPVTDKIIDDMVIDEATLFFSGTRSAEEVVNTLQNRVQLYLDE
jgi:multiple sugar transport system substrate-binding protein